jgi:hypothetical protein
MRFRSWGSNLKLKSKVNRRLDGGNLIICEWEMMFNPILRMAALFLIESNIESSAVFGICPSFEIDEEFAGVLLTALLELDDSFQVDVSSRLPDDQT